jgi:hypothetical protein
MQIGPRRRDELISGAGRYGCFGGLWLGAPGGDVNHALTRPPVSWGNGMVTRAFRVGVYLSRL